jgi:hypothetical protein
MVILHFFIFHVMDYDDKKESQRVLSKNHKEAIKLIFFYYFSIFVSYKELIQREQMKKRCFIIIIAHKRPLIENVYECAESQVKQIFSLLFSHHQWRDHHASASQSVFKCSATIF